MRERRSTIAGLALVPVLGWIFATFGFGMAIYAWTGERGEAKQAPSGADDPEIRTLRLAVSTAEAENAALRGELDRLLTGGSPRGGAPATTGGPSANGAASLSGEERTRLATDLRDAVARAAATGNKTDALGAAVSLMSAFRQGRAAYPALVEAYEGSTDPEAKKLLLPTLLFVGGAEARDFLVEQVHSEADPAYRNLLLAQSAKYATPEQAARLQDVYLDALGGSGQLDPQTRAAAVRGLRYAKGPEVHDALLAAATDPSEDVRLAALESLSSRPDLRDRLSEIVRQDPSPFVREIGECRLLVSEGG